jgi:hypothetical protein
LERGKRPKKLNVFAQITGFLSFRLQIPDGHGNLQAVGKCLFAKARLAALTDGVFSVTMTLLVFDVRLPEDFHPADDGRASARLGQAFAFEPICLGGIDLSRRQRVGSQKFSPLNTWRDIGDIKCPFRKSRSCRCPEPFKPIVVLSAAVLPA